METANILTDPTDPTTTIALPAGVAPVTPSTVSPLNTRFEIPEAFRGLDYPESWDDMVGQELAKNQIRLAAKSARIRSKPLAHTLIASGVAGLGKTSLALLTAAEMGTKVVPIAGQTTAQDFRVLVNENDLQDGDLVLMDEFHKMMDGGKRNAEWMLHYLQDFTLMGPLGPEKMPHITIIAATTHASVLPETILGRFPLIPQMTGYTLEEASRVAAKMAERVLADSYSLASQPTESNCEIIAEASNRNPRAIRQLLCTLRDLAVTGEIGFDPHDGYDMDIVLMQFGVTADGLDRAAQRYLVTLAEVFNGTAGEEALKDMLQEPGGLNTVERVLFDKRLVTRAAKGRTLTNKGKLRVQNLDVTL